MVLGTFAGTKVSILSQAEGASPAGATPGNTEKHVDTRVGFTRAMRSPRNTFLMANPKMDSDTHHQAVWPEP